MSLLKQKFLLDLGHTPPPILQKGTFFTLSLTLTLQIVSLFRIFCNFLEQSDEYLTRKTFCISSDTIAFLARVKLGIRARQVPLHLGYLHVVCWYLHKPESHQQSLNNIQGEKTSLQNLSETPCNSCRADRVKSTGPCRADRLRKTHEIVRWPQEKWLS